MVGNWGCLNKKHQFLRRNCTIHFSHDGILFIRNIFLKANTFPLTKIVIIIKTTPFSINIMVL